MHRFRTFHGGPGVRAGGLLSVLGALGALLILAAAASPAGASPRSAIFDPAATPSWTAFVAGAGPGDDAARHVVTQGADTTFMCGDLMTLSGGADMSVTKYVGAVARWTRTFGGPAGGNDMAVRMALSPDGKAIYVTGMARYASGPDLVLLKYSAQTGKRLWVRRYDGPAHGPDLGWAMGVDREGNVVVCGYSISASDFDSVVASWTASGSRRWVWRYGVAGSSEVLTDLWVAPDGTTYASGVKQDGSSQRGLLVRLSKAGRRMWLRQYAGQAGLGAGFACMTPRPGGGLYVGGVTVSSATADDAILLRYTPRGARTVFAVDAGAGGASDEVFRDVVVTSTKHVVGVGKTETAGSNDFRLVVYRPDGTVRFPQTMGGAGEDEWVCAAADPFGGFYVAGTAQLGPADKRMAVQRISTAADGTGFLSRWSPVVVSDCDVYAIAARGTSAYVAGSISSGGPGGVDQALLVYTW